MMFVVVWYVSFSPPGRRNHTQFTDVCDVCVCRMSIQNSIGGLVGCVFFLSTQRRYFARLFSLAHTHIICIQMVGIQLTGSHYMTET